MSITAEGTVGFVFNGVPFHIGMVLNQDEADALPVGSVVTDSNGATIDKLHEGSCKRRDGSGWYYRRPGREGRVTPLANGVNTLTSVPVPSVPETLPEFKARFAARVREVTAEYTPTHRRVAERVLADLEMVGTTGVDGAAEGALAKKGAPDEPGFTIWRFEDQRWVRIYGDAPLGQCRVKAAGDLDEFRRAAWEQGQAAKQRFKWCSVFDKVMEEFGITDPEPMPDFSRYPTLVKAQEGRDALPVGSVIGAAKGDWGVFEKTAANGGPDDWRRVCGTRPVAAGTMRLLHRGDGQAEGKVRIVDYGLSQFMPGCATAWSYIIRLP